MQSIRECFAGKVRDGGVESVIKSLSDKNRQGDARFESHQTGTFYVLAIIQSVLQGRR